MEDVGSPLRGSGKREHDIAAEVPGAVWTGREEQKRAIDEPGVVLETASRGTQLRGRFSETGKELLISGLQIIRIICSSY
jgi:hypothetical protein